MSTFKEDGKRLNREVRKIGSDILDGLISAWHVVKGAERDAPWVFWPCLAIIIYAVVSAVMS